MIGHGNIEGSFGITASNFLGSATNNSAAQYVKIGIGTSATTFGTTLGKYTTRDGVPDASYTTIPIGDPYTGKAGMNTYTDTWTARRRHLLHPVPVHGGAQGLGDRQHRASNDDIVVQTPKVP